MKWVILELIIQQGAVFYYNIKEMFEKSSHSFVTVLKRNCIVENNIIVDATI